MPDLDLSRLTVFHGELNPQQAYVYVRCDGGASPSGLRLQGRITGPRSRLTRTLPATVALHDMGKGPSPLARAIVPDPCYWSPGEPYLYDVHVQWATPTEILADTDRTVGLRAFGAREGQLLLEAKPWQLLAAAQESVQEDAWPAWRETGLARFVLQPNDLQCRQASEEGVMLIAHLQAGTAAGLEDVIRRLSRHAAVAIVSLSANSVVPESVRNLAPNVVLAQYCSQTLPAAPAAWADLLICKVRDPGAAIHSSTGRSLPVLIHSPLGRPTSLAEARHVCQQSMERGGPLQHLAGWIV